jgi:signal transduction histidine kinase
MRLSLVSLRLAGLMTWLVAGVPRLFGSHDAAFGVWVAAWLAFGVTFWFSTDERAHGWSRSMRVGTTVAQSVLAIIALALHPSGFMPVLLVVVAGAVAGAVALPVALAWLGLHTLIIGAIFAWAKVPPDEFLAVTASYFAFQVFALLAVHLAQSESSARQELAVANAELRATADLLDASSRANERLRIARDLHDLLGHHLTALSVNLEVAAHLTDGKARGHVEHAQSLAKLLLSDVRAVVSDLRDDQAIDVASMLARLIAPVPSPRVELSLEPDLHVADPAIAQALVHAAQEILTNAMRHSRAATLRLDVRRAGGAFELRADDDGIGTSPLRLGNGLTGIRERADAAGGSAEFRSARGAGFHVVLTLPAARESL